MLDDPHGQRADELYHYGSGPAPQSQPVAPAPRLERFAPSVAFEPGLRMLAAGPAQYLTVLLFERLCERPQNKT